MKTYGLIAERDHSGVTNLPFWRAMVIQVMLFALAYDGQIKWTDPRFDTYPGNNTWSD